MGYAEFEEKEFEKPLYNQLENGRCNVWTPGQCFEAHIGFDYSGEIELYEFWNRFGGFIPGGVILKDYNMGYVLKKLKEKRILPDFRLNLFIQAKRPYVHSGAYRGSVYATKHYSFEINKRQQLILEKLVRKLRHRALVVYASPVFGTLEELYRHTKDGTIISNTSFPKVSDLTGHDRWYYCNATEGVAHSEPEEVEIYNIFELIDIYKDEYHDRADLGYDENLYILADTITKVLEENFLQDFQVQSFFEQVNHMRLLYERIDYNANDKNYRAITSFLTIVIFCDTFNLDWFTL